MRAVIVGHGPSLLNNPEGEWIDSHDIVIRLKRSKDLTRTHPEFYGKRCDIAAGSWNILPALRSWGAKQYWALFDSRHDDVTEDQIQAMRGHFEPRDLVADKEFCEHWQNIYRTIAAPMELEHGMVRHGNEHGHPHMSQGSNAIVHALHFLQPEVLNLIGFDNVATGEFTWSITRGPDWEQYPDHNWKAEKQLLSVSASEYPETLIDFIFPEAD